MQERVRNEGPSDPETILTKTRNLWLEVEGVKSTLDGEPTQEIESYFRQCRLNLGLRLIAIERSPDERKFLSELPLMRREIEVCELAFDYLLECLRSKQ